MTEFDFFKVIYYDDFDQAYKNHSTHLSMEEACNEAEEFRDMTHYPTRVIGYVTEIIEDYD